MIDCDIHYRSKGYSWGFKPGDSMILREGQNVLLEIQAELVIDMLVSELHRLRLLKHMADGTVPKRTMAKVLANEAEAPTPDLIERRRLARRSRKWKMLASLVAAAAVLFAVLDSVESRIDTPEEFFYQVDYVDPYQMYIVHL